MITVNRRDKLDWHPGMTVREMLDKMNYNYPLITVTINGEFVPPEDYDDTTIPDGADVRAIHVHHGG